MKLRSDTYDKYMEDAWTHANLPLQGDNVY